MIDYRNYKHGTGYLKNYYVCSECGSRAMKQEPHSINERIYLCMECGSAEFEPQVDMIFPPAQAMKENIAWIGFFDLLDLVYMKTEQLN